jgi:hypothetical protein
VTAIRPLGTRARKPPDWQKTLIVRSEPFSVAPVFLPHFSAGTLEISPETPEETYLAMTVSLQVLRSLQEWLTARVNTDILNRS